MGETATIDPGLATSRKERVALPDSHGRSYPPIEIWRFGEVGARPKAYIQTGLHADELPGMLVVRKMAEELEALHQRGAIKGEVVLVPVANPIGLSQIEGGYLMGRVERATSRNFNRGYPDLYALVKDKIAEKLGGDEAENLKIIRKAMRKAVAKIEPDDAFGVMQKTLTYEACDADIVLDVHADNEAMIHLYVGEANWPDATDLAAEIDARAVLLTDESGGDPFDEAFGFAWPRLQQAFPDKPIPMGTLSATLELRSNNHVTHRDSDRDVRALMRFLTRRGVLDGEAGALPRLLCEAYPIRAMQQLRAPIEGLIVYCLALGDSVRKGDLIAEIVPPLGGPVAHVVAETDGLLFARHDQTWAWESKVIGKVAGRDVLESRKGDLLTP
ncbi:MAG: succinylglutamate desuccinylase/aspartoacylase family protein [Pseudomonadota bacterium]